MLTAKEVFYKIKHSKDKFHQKVNERLRDRVKYETNQTLKTVQKLKNKGLSEERILKEIEKSSEMPKKENENNS